MTSPDFDQRPEVFFGYPSRPAQSKETLQLAAEYINEQSDEVRAVTWEDLDNVGILMIDQITKAIDRSLVSVFDVTYLNPNVLFEVGYAVGCGSHIYLSRDTTDRKAEAEWREFGLLASVGFADYADPMSLALKFLNERPQDRSETILDELSRTFDPVDEPAIFYLKRLYYSQAEKEITRRISRWERDGVRLFEADPNEDLYETLAWYSNQCHRASAAVIHLVKPDRIGSEAHNARCALVAGIAHGMGRPVLMLAEEGYDPPLDYRELLFVYKTAKQARERTDQWLKTALKEAVELQEARTQEAETRHLNRELANIRLGESVAEYEADSLSNYFRETPVFDAIVAGTAPTVMVGRKGAGKTAMLLEASERLAEDQRNLVTLLQPTAFDLQGVVRVLSKLSGLDAKGYAIEALWRFLITSEIARAVVERASEKPAGIAPGSALDELQAYLGELAAGEDADLVVRLERAVKEVEGSEGQTVEGDRSLLTEALYSGRISKLQRLLAPALDEFDTVAIFIDNLDRAWESEADTDAMSRLLLGLLSGTSKFGREISKRVGGIAVRMTVFMRNDIYFRLSEMVAEPDKIPVAIVEWTDPDELLLLVEERFVADRNYEAAGAELWSRYFCATVEGVPTKEYFARRVLPRPRDMIRLVRTSIDQAVRLNQRKVREEDVMNAERSYSQFAFDSLIAEGVESLPEIEEFLYAIAGERNVLSRSDLALACAQVGIGTERLDAVIDALVSLTFLGLQTSLGTFEFAENAREAKRMKALADRVVVETGNEPEYRVHAAFEAALALNCDSLVGAGEA